MWRMINSTFDEIFFRKVGRQRNSLGLEVVVVEGKIGFDGNVDVNASIWHTSIEKSVL